MEPVRLVIWDLDETFWDGTLTEGGLRYNRAHHDIVVELARRGIMNAICSKNDLERVRPVLEQHGIWDYFIFPSINWDPKGARVARIIENAQLRPASVMFIDDNPMNLEEVRFLAPDVQLADETFIRDILASPLFTGKPDPELTRLKQYRLLEAKHEEKEKSGGDNSDFLRSSDIRVVFDYALNDKLDRIVELINRTNQLNFTKRRLPEDPEAAREEIGRLLSHYQTQAALIRVVDRYGDYGYVGFYAQKRDGRGTQLLHFCFSCRILNMGIETWVYRHIGAPDLKVVGEVLTDVVHDTAQIDWVRATTADDAADAPDRSSVRYDRIISHGGCDQRALAHYLAPHADIEVGEYNISRHGLQLRTDSSWMLRYALTGAPPEAMADLIALGFVEADFTTEINWLEGSNNLVLLSFWMDSTLPLMRHKVTGMIIPYSKRELEEKVTPDASGFYAQALETLTRGFEPAGMVREEDLRRNIEFALGRIGNHARVVIVKSNTTYFQTKANITAKKQRQNKVIDDIAERFGHVTAVDVAAYIDAENEAHTGNHFDRMVYYRLYKGIMAALVPPSQPAIDPYLEESA